MSKIYVVVATYRIKWDQNEDARTAMCVGFQDKTVANALRDKLNKARRVNNKLDINDIEKYIPLLIRSEAMLDYNDANGKTCFVYLDFEVEELEII